MALHCKGSSCFNSICIFRLMAEHEKSWDGPDGVPITVGTVKVENPSEMLVEGKVYDNNAIDKSDSIENRKILNGNTMRQTVATKSKKLAKNLSQRCLHMEKRLSLVQFHVIYIMAFRKHALIFRLCVEELDGTVCAMCRKTPHTLPLALVRDLPKRSQGGLFWDITEDPNLPGIAIHLHSTLYILIISQCRLPPHSPSDTC